MAEAAVAALPGVHLKEVAKKFGVHLRTVFRWIARGSLRSEGGLVNGDDVAKNLALWQASCPLDVARDRLGVTSGTIRNWRRKGLLEIVTVGGLDRVTLASVEKMERRQEGRVLLVKPGYVRKCYLLDFLAISSNTLNALIERGEIPSIEVNGVTLIPEDKAKEIEDRWNATCKPAAVKNVLDLSDYGFHYFVDKGTLEVVSIFGVRRVTLESVKRTKEAKKVWVAERAARKEAWAAARVNLAVRKAKAKQEREKLRAEGKKVSARRAEKKEYRPGSGRETLLALKQSFLDAQRKKKSGLAKKGPRPNPDHRFTPVIVPGFETRRLVTCEDVAEASGRPLEFIEAKYVAGRLRGVRSEEGRLYIYLSSAQVFVQLLAEK